VSLARRRGPRPSIDTDAALTAPHVGCRGQLGRAIDIAGADAGARQTFAASAAPHWNGPPLRRVTWGERCYLVPWDDGTLLVGATVEDVGFDERTTMAGVRDLIDAACELVPQGWTASLKTARAGLRPGTPDGLPIIGRSGVLPGLVYATGHYRSGVQLAPLTATLSQICCRDKVDPLLDLVAPARFGC
jgi:glycine/D-amino acid oxidase-like deaminating enzyme